MNVGMMACYDQAKEACAKVLDDPMTGGQPALKTQLASSAIAGFTAALFSMPFDLVKSRLMAMKLVAKSLLPASNSKRPALMTCSALSTSMVLLSTL